MYEKVNEVTPEKTNSKASEASKRVVLPAKGGASSSKNSAPTSLRATLVEVQQKPNGTCLLCKVKLPEGSSQEKKYCSPGHSKTAQRRRAAAARKREEKMRESFDPNLIGRCPFPKKIAYSSKDEAMQVIKETERWTLVPYLCNCLMWHVGNNRLGSKEEFEGGYKGDKFKRVDKKIARQTMERMREDYRKG